MTTIILFFLLILNIGNCVVPEDNFFEGIFKGEGVNCDATFAKVDVTSQQVVKTEEEVITAVAEAIAESTEGVIDVDSAVAASESSAESILEVVAEAVASIAAFINSPAPTCWAIAFGKTQAVAIANATVTAIGQGIARALDGKDQLAAVETVVQSEANDIEVAVETIALLLQDGSGAGFQFDRKDARAVARARAINCVLARAFARILPDGTDETIVLTQAGCLESPSPVVPEPEPITDGCECIEERMGDIPGGCGRWGDVENGDTICYVKDPERCPCDWGTDRYDGTGAHWRYCGPTLRTMQQYLNFVDDTDSDIIGVQSSWAFCAKGTWNPDRDDSTMAPSPSPTPTPIYTPAPTPTPAWMAMVPSPTPTTIPQEDCPSFRCLGASKCCNLPEGVDTCIVESTEYKLEGTCENTGEKVFLPNVGFRCRCAA